MMLMTTAAFFYFLQAPVPSSYAVPTQFERVVIVRCKNGTDLLEELRKQAKDQKIENAIILGGFGSVTSSHYHVVANATIPAKDDFVKDANKPADILGMQGAILNGKVHAHLTLAGSGPAYGGHLEPETKVFTFAIVTLGVLPAKLDLRKLDDQHHR
jgi:predicted DNA-binding protein with PD1-like motif